MDADFLARMERAITGVGTDKVWKKSILGRTVWFSPIDVTRQAKVVEAIQNPEMGTAAWDDAKRVSLAAAVVGMDDMDFRPARDAGPIFAIPARNGAEKKVDLATYIYHKVASWDSDFFDAAYDVFVDLMETHRRECRKDITFENAKDPREELMELEQRAAELRERLKLPHLVEAGSVGTEEDADRRERLEQDSPPESPSPEFDPFAPISTETAARPQPAPAPSPAVRSAAEPEPAAEPEFEKPVVYGTLPSAVADPRILQARAAAEAEGKVLYSGDHELPDAVFSAAAPVTSVPIPVAEPDSDESKMTPIQREMARQGRKLPMPVSTVGQPRRHTIPNPADPSKPIHLANAGSVGDVVESRAQRTQANPPVINPGVAGMNRNPRFARPSR